MNQSGMAIDRLSSEAGLDDKGLMTRRRVGMMSRLFGESLFDSVFSRLNFKTENQ
jgi:hypothetical protein